MNKQIFMLSGQIARLIAVAAVGTLALPSNADAALLFTSSDSFTNELTELFGTPELTLTKYAPPAGVVVTDVQLMLTASLTTEGTITQFSTQALPSSVIIVVAQFDVVPQSDSPPLATLQPFAPFEFIGQQDYVKIEPGETVPFGPFTLNGMANQSITGGEITALLGPGTVTFAPFTLMFTIFQGGSFGELVDIQTLADATLTIKYFGTTQATPEPATLLGLLAIAGLGTTVLKNRRA